MVEHHTALHRLLSDLRRVSWLGVGPFLFLVQQLEGAFGGRERGLQRVDHVAGFGQRFGHLVDVLVERLRHADGHAAAKYHPTGEQHHRHLREPRDHADQRIDGYRDEVGELRGFSGAFGGVLHRCRTVFLAIVCLDDVAALVVFLGQAGQLSDGLLTQ